MSVGASTHNRVRRLLAALGNGANYTGAATPAQAVGWTSATGSVRLLSALPGKNREEVQLCFSNTFVP